MTARGPDARRQAHSREGRAATMQRAPLTIRDIAAMARVSQGTVSKVLNEAPGVGAETRSRIYAENQAVLEADFVGTHIGTFAGIPATRRKVRVPLCVVYDLEEGKIKRGRVYLEVPVLLRQLGAAPAEREVAKR